mgnify:CR=1 FL=1
MTRPCCPVFMHGVYSFHVPAFVLISGYVSGDMNPKRRRALISGIIAPYILLQAGGAYY